MTEPVFKHTIPLRQFPPLWVFKLLAKLGLAKRYTVTDKPDGGVGFSVRAEAYFFLGFCYLTKMEVVK